MTIYDKGDGVRLSAAFVDINGVATNPTTVTLRIRNSAGSTVYTYAASEIIRDSAGNYHKDVSLSVAGDWTYRWEGTGAVETAMEGLLSVRRSRF